MDAALDTAQLPLRIRSGANPLVPASGATHPDGVIAAF